MNITLSILDKDKNILDVSNATINSSNIVLSDVITDSILGLDLQAGNDYNIVIPVDINAPTSIFTITSPDDGTLNIVVTPGNNYTFTPATTINQLDFSVLSVALETYNQTVTINGEDITVTVDDGTTTQTFNGSNLIVITVVNDSNVTITVESGGYFTYSNTIRVYNYDIPISVVLIENITDVNDLDYRFPYPHFFYILEPCSFSVYIYNSQSAPFGRISYEVADNEISAGQQNTIFDTCNPDIIDITQRIIVREIPNCGGTSPILYNETYTIEGVTTTEYRPELVLNRSLNCCELIDRELVIYPSIIELYNIGIHECDITTVSPSLVYNLTLPDGTTSELASYTGTEISTFDLDDLGFSYTPTQLGSYTLEVQLTNCCTTTAYTIIFDMCNSYAVTNSDCNIIQIQNLSSANSLTYSIRELQDDDTFDFVTVNNVVQENITVPGNTTIELDLSVDNIYAISVNGGEEQLFLLDCNIKKCKKKLLLDYLCIEDGCNELTLNERRLNWLKFNAFEELIYAKWDEWKQQQSIYTTMSINDEMEDILYISDLIEEITKICSSCGATNKCSREARCSYTLTNFGYIVPARFNSIIYNKTSEDCGCS